MESFKPSANQRLSGVYCIFCYENGKIYIGSSNNPSTRKSGHFCSLRKNKHHSRHLQRAWNKYGSKAFRFVVLENTIEENLTKLEQEYMDLFSVCNSDYGFNVLPEAGSQRGYVPTKETRDKQSRMMTGKIKSPETVALLKQAWIENREEWVARDIANRGKEFEIMSPDGKIFRGKGVKQFARQHNLDDAQLFRVLKGKNLSIEGWKLPSAPDLDYHFLSPDGEKVTVSRGKLKDFAKKLGLSSSRLSQMWLKRVPFYRDWIRYDAPISCTELITPDGQPYSLPMNKQDKFCRENGISAVSLGALTSGRLAYVKGWSLAQTKAPFYRFLNRTKQAISIPFGTLTEFCEKNELSAQMMASLWSGKKSYYNGWTRYDRPDLFVDLVGPNGEEISICKKSFSWFWKERGLHKSNFAAIIGSRGLSKSTGGWRLKSTVVSQLVRPIAA